MAVAAHPVNPHTSARNDQLERIKHIPRRKKKTEEWTRLNTVFLYLRRLSF